MRHDSEPRLASAARALQAWLLRRLAQMAGGFLAMAALAGCVALISFDPNDPSWNTAADGAPTNLLGAPGAIFADLMLQGFGLASFLALAPLAVWGARIMVSSGRWTARPRELALWPMSVLAGAVALGFAPTGPDWPLASGLGGAVGGQLSVALATGLRSLGAPEMAQVAVVAALCIATVAAFGAAVSGWRPLFRAGLWLMGGLFRRTGEDEAPARTPPRPAPPRSAPARSRAAPKTRKTEVKTAPKPTKRPPHAPAPDVDRPPPRSTKPALQQRPLALHDDQNYTPPPLDLLAPAVMSARDEADDEALQQNARLLETVLSEFGVRGEVVKVRPGPVVTMYEFEPAAGVKSARVIGLSDDVARSMSAIACRIAVIPGRSALGVELPNAVRETVHLREQFEAPEFVDPRFALPLALGKNIGGGTVVADLAKMPHLLVAGTTGSGKSVAVNAMILSLVQRLSPERCRLVLIDPKMLELSVYDGIPHLLTPVVTDPKKAVAALRWTVREMESRYQAMSKIGVRNLTGFNAKVEEAAAKGEVLKRQVQTGFDPENGQPIYEDEILDLKPMPYLVVFIDEMADLMLGAGKDIEAAVQRLAQMARAAGIHLVTATQRPSVDVITGTIKANFPTRISFQVTSKIDSRTILGEQGAEQLLGRGDMLFMAGGGRVQRVHGPFVSDAEVEAVARYLKSLGPPAYVEAVTESEQDSVGGPLEPFGGESGDDLYDQAVAIVGRDKRASTSYVQRRLKIGYNRAASLIERMEEEGVVSAPNHAGKREVLIGEPGEGVRE